ncbi:uncharacterized protein LOC142341793 [Convolutriloba macropyga]|uniref:uncharacterized protein LOC142341793 n=1 Tax=Convolutriloba macropyga TaxID=536237 RepID=UPI003F528EDC
MSGSGSQILASFLNIFLISVVLCVLSALNCSGDYYPTDLDFKRTEGLFESPDLRNNWSSLRGFNRRNWSSFRSFKRSPQRWSSFRSFKRRSTDNPLD